MSCELFKNILLEFFFWPQNFWGQIFERMHRDSKGDPKISHTVGLGYLLLPPSGLGLGLGHPPLELKNVIVSILDIFRS